MAHAARALGLGVMLGCMVESGPRHRRRRAHREPDGSRRPRRQPAARRRPVAGRRRSPTASSFPPTRRGSALQRPRRLLDPRRGPLRRPALRQDGARRHPLPARGRRRDARLDARGRDRRRLAGRRARSPTRSPFEPTTALVGVATQGGRFPPAWRELLKDSIAAGLDVENGLHEFISDDDGARRARARARRRAARPAQAARRASTCRRARTSTHAATTILTVGSDCAIGKMTVVARARPRGAQRRGIRSEFVPTGQTGIAIAGWGISVDAVVADFIAGAAEQLVVEGVERGGEVLFVEGQGSLLHPAYSGVTLGLIHGSRAARATSSATWPASGRRRGRALPDPAALRARRAARADQPARRGPRGCSRSRSTRGCSTRMPPGARSTETEAETGLPADDPVRFGAGRLVDSLEPLIKR